MLDVLSLSLSLSGKHPDERDIQVIKMHVVGQMYVSCIFNSARDIFMMK